MKKCLQLVMIPVLFLAAAAHAQGASIKITWTDQSNKEDYFSLQRNLANSVTGMVEIVRPPAATATAPVTVLYTDTGLVELQNYCYRVAACNAAGCSAYTAIACGITLGAGVPSPPINLKADPVPATSGQLAPELQPETAPQQMSAAAAVKPAPPGWTRKQIEEQTYDPQYFAELRSKHWKLSDPR